MKRALRPYTSNHRPVEPTIQLMVLSRVWCRGIDIRPPNERFSITRQTSGSLSNSTAMIGVVPLWTGMRADRRSSLSKTAFRRIRAMRSGSVAMRSNDAEFL